MRLKPLRRRIAPERPRYDYRFPVFELDHTNAAVYLSSRGYDGAALRVTPLGGGVSSTVLLVEGAGIRLVLKQSLAKLRVEMDWFSERERIFRESAALRELGPVLGEGLIPEVIFEDRDNCLFAMTAAAPGSQSWKSVLMDGRGQESTAATIGRMLASLISASRSNPRLEAAFGDQTVFGQLRLDPYYATTAARHPDLAAHFSRLIQQCAERRFSLVHGDWSPKNFLVNGGTVMAIDFEVIHYGDPCFDVAFLVNHLLLKSFHLPRWAGQFEKMARSFWRAVAEALPGEAGWLEEGAVRHLGGLLLARIDGKSPAEYIRDESVKRQIRSFARELILNPPGSLAGVFERRAGW